jgi:ABC-type phosphate transport system permease subunit
MNPLSVCGKRVLFYIYFMKNENNWLALGIALGVTFGLLFHNLAIGISLGVAFGVFMQNYYKGKNKDNDPNPQP